ncbi:type II toxin-antitoxin system HicA family toxin [Breznakiellaceae bacterium SP9]
MIKKIISIGAVFVRHGGNHDVYRNPRTGEIEEVPRHPDVNESLAKSIIKTMSH